MSEKLRALIVDYGGVLTTDVRSTHRQWLAAENIDVEIFREVMREWMAPDAAANPVHALETGQLPGPQFEAALASALSTRSGTHIPAPDLLKRMFGGFADEPAMYEVLRRARRAGLKTALLSNSWSNEYDRALWHELFDVTVISGEVGLRKPDPAIYELTARRLGLPVDACVFVDDLRANVQAAAQVGMVGVLHRDTDATVAELEALFGWDAEVGSETAHER
jgi:putative hydrolase of the HAD superfamily